jgi:cellobiose-specific phosphotransferase system component IIA
LETNELDWEQTLFTVILHAGNARSLAKEAAELASEGDFEGAEAKMVEANEEQVKAHEVQAKIIRMEAQGEQVPFSILLIHSMDLLLLAWAEVDNSEQFIELYRRLDALSKE